MPACFLCGDPLTPAAAGRFTHPPVAYCNVKATDSYGIAVDAPVVEAPLAQAFLLSVFAPVDAALPEVFAAAGVPRLGGQSTGRGWSSFALFQRCPYAWQRRYVTPATPGAVMESPALAVGTLLHTYLAVTYQRLIDPAYPLTPEGVDQALRAAGCNPTFLDTAWRVFDGYRLHYTHDVLTPLAVEHDLVDPRTGESCRYDLIAHFPDSAHGRPAGTYIVEHKSASRFDGDTLEGWANDGEVIGQVMLWHKLRLDLFFGPLQGVLINLLGKQPKNPQYQRVWVKPTTAQVTAHRDDLARWEGLIQLARSTGSFPRARNGCIGRYGRCPHFDHCATGEP